MAVDLKSMTTKQLEKLSANVAKEMESRASKQKDAAMKAAEKGSEGTRLRIVRPCRRTPAKRTRAKAAPKAKLPPKIQEPPPTPRRPGRGAGRQPDWYKAAIQSGASPQSLENLSRQ